MADPPWVRVPTAWRGVGNRAPAFDADRPASSRRRKAL